MMLRKMLALTAAACCLSLTARADHETPRRKLLDDAIDRLEELFEQDFSVRFRSDELARTISGKILEVSRQMGMPVKIDIRDFLVRFDEETKAFKSQLRLKDTGDFMAMALQEQANAMLQNDGARIGQRLCDLSLGALHRFCKVLDDNEDAIRFAGEKDGKARFSLSPRNLQLNGLAVQELVVSVDPETRAIDRLEAAFAGGHHATFSLTSAPQSFKGRRIMVPTQVKLEHDLPEFKGLALPPTASIDFRKFKLHD